MADSTRATAGRPHPPPRNQLHLKFQLSVRDERKETPSCSVSTSTNDLYTFGKKSCEAQTPAATSTRSKKISFNPEAKEFVPRGMGSSNPKSRSPVGKEFESQVLAITQDENETGEGCEGESEPSFSDKCLPPLSTPGRSYAEIASAGVRRSSHPDIIDSLQELCPYAMNGECRFGEKCVLVHGLVCDYCQKGCLHPTNQAQREMHIRECINQHQIDMEHSFAIARSADKMCGICMEVVVEKALMGERRFGILTACNHCYCLSCIRQWRRASDFDNKVIRACPECRISSDFVCPSRVWVETKEDKERLIWSYKQALREKECRHYKHGDGICPFGNKCFYRHTNKNGTPVDVGPPIRLYPRQPMSVLSDFMLDFNGTWSHDLNIIMFGDGLSDTDSEFDEFSEFL